jgi:large conductance mechanosensitive channel
MVVKAMNKAVKKKKEEPAPVGPTDVELLTEIRDLLKK